MKPYFSAIKEQINQRAKESSLSILSINKPGLRKHLDKVLTTDEPFVKGPVLEPMFGWETQKDKTMNDLVSDGVISQELVAALDSKDNGKNRFGADWSPYKHQYEAWKSLLSSSPQSRVITSGTGSGKTECFMVPVLQDLLNIKNSEGGCVEGVHALFLYPLNALINSQKDRLNAWTQHFNGDIRFCLYNGHTPENNSGKLKQDQDDTPQEVLSRQLMREKPAPILVTNGTMLEYMLIRQADSPILEKSQGKLRWIILDEAHSYVGSQAAELALQLRRVINAFNVNAKDVRFVATSATIAGKDTELKLQKYLAELAGVDENQVAVIPGQRVTPKIEEKISGSIALEDIQQIKSGSERYKALCRSAIARDIRNVLTNPKNNAITIDDLRVSLSEHKLSESELLNWLDVCTASESDSSSNVFLKVRAHYFQRTLHGLWSCINKECTEKKHSLIEKEWPFGYVYTKFRSECKCGFPVLEVNFCNECKEPHLIGMDYRGRLKHWHTQVEDEFSLQSEIEIEDPEEGVEIDNPKEERKSIKTNDTLVLAERGISDDSSDLLYEPIEIDTNGQIGAIEGGVKLSVSYQQLNDSECAYCGHKGYGQNGKALRHAILGAPFYLTNLVPHLLEFCPDFKESKKNNIGVNSLPARGRRMITFTDSRQGTARLTVKMQQDSERMLIRKLVIGELIDTIEEVSSYDLPQDFDNKYVDFPIEQLELIKKVLPKEEVATINTIIAAKQKGKVSRVISKSIKWAEILSAISKKDTLSKLATAENKQWLEDKSDSDDARDFAEVLLLREFARRPKRQNNLETIGLVKLVYPKLEKIKYVPERWGYHGLNLKDWKNFLKVTMDFYIRENSFCRISDEQKRFIGLNFSSKQLIAHDSNDESDLRVKKWPQYNSKGNPNRLIKLLCLGAGLDLRNTVHVDDINLWLQSAWKVLTDGKVLDNNSSKYQLDFKDVEISLVNKAYVCPVTNRLIDTTFKGLTPYIANLNKVVIENLKCVEVKMPSLNEFDVHDKPENHIDLVRKAIDENELVRKLRENNLWTDISDRVIEGEPYYTVAEHSAQQSSDRLKKYEKLFKAGKKNVMNCSTTMEMGVDIGGISTVLMSNVPPHPANYLQRAGRAGRSQESRALSYTLCKHNPHDLRVFSDNSWAFNTEIEPPYVTFSASKLVNRHVNSYILSCFFNQFETTKEKISLKTEWFYQDGENSKANSLIKYMDSLSAEESRIISNLVKGTASASLTQSEIIEAAKLKISELIESWQSQINYILKEKSVANKDGPYWFKLLHEENRLNSENLITHLSKNGFLPGYGFPTDVVNLDNDNVVDYIRRKRNKINTYYRALPSRNMAVAIREYAPGSDVVVDGKVFRCQGLKLNSQYAYASTEVDAQNFSIAWHCDQCGQKGVKETLADDKFYCNNPDCGSEIKQSNMHNTIEPMGFAVDYYTKPTNNVEHQKFMPFKKPWIIAKGEWVALPRVEIGFMRMDLSGSVYHYTDGFNDKGYALCLSCGRAESMSTDEIPKSLKDHKPLRPDKFSRDSNTNERKPCNGKVETNLRIGFEAETDVFELALKNTNSEWIFPLKDHDKEHGKKIATTLAVAMRSGLAGLLGISTNELNYNIQQIKNKAKQPIYVIQIFDAISGGAGFASEAPHLINQLLKKTVEVLNCNMSCEAYCPHCLLEIDSRHDVEWLDRKEALAWLGSDFEDRLETKFEWSDLQNPRYVVENLKQKLASLLRYKTDEITFVWRNEQGNWDVSTALVSQQIHQVVHKIKANNPTLQLNIIVPETINHDDIKEFLLKVEQLGVNLMTASVSDKAVYQVVQGAEVTTVENEVTQCQIPGSDWLYSDGTTIESKSSEKWSLSPLDTTKWIKQKASNANTVTVIYTNELNGPLTKFGSGFQKLLKNKAPDIYELIAKESIKSIHYTDRFVRSPSALMLIAQIIKSFPLSNEAEVHLSTSVNKKPNYRSKIFDDWDNKDIQENTIRKYLKSQLEPKLSEDINDLITIDVLERQTDLQHARSLKIITTSGQEMKINFDHGVGCWRIFDKSNKFVKFNHSLSPSNQADTLVERSRYYMVKENKQDSENYLYIIKPK